MKVTIKNIALVALLLGTMGVNALGTTNTPWMKSNDILINDLVSKGQTWLIKNAEGEIVYDKRQDKELAFDSLMLDDGNYTLEIEKAFEIKVMPFSVKQGITSIDEQSSTIIHKPVVRKESNKVLVSRLTLDAKPLEVTLYFEGDVIYKDVVSGGAVLSRIYKLRKDIKGDYKIVMKANDRVYSKEFSL